jgi:esterase
MEHQDDIVAGLQAVDLAAITNRQEADAAWPATFPSWACGSSCLKPVPPRGQFLCLAHQPADTLTASLPAVGEATTSPTPS